MNMKSLHRKDRGLMQDEHRLKEVYKAIKSNDGPVRKIDNH